MMVYIGLLGCGTVGSGVVELLERRMGKIADLTGVRPVLKRVLIRDPRKPRGDLVSQEWLTTRPEDILEDPEIQIVVETIGGIEPARDYILRAIRCGKNVITANKDLMAAHGDEIHAAADSAGVSVLYEAAVGGAIPVIRPLRECLPSNEITSIKGIINGTSNYILSQMTERGDDFDFVLAEAQELGYAEADPSGDVDGWDAARKLVILAALAFHVHASVEDVQVHGIRSVSAADVAYAKQLGCVIKLIAEGTDVDDSIRLEVRPTLIPKQNPLAHVGDANNALYVHGDAAGDLMFSGRGAGSLPTASAVVGDLIEVLRSIDRGGHSKAQHMRLVNKRIDRDRAVERDYYVRLVALDQPGVLADVANAFSAANVSIKSVLQNPMPNGRAELVIVTHRATSHTIQTVTNLLKNHTSVPELCNVMPVDRLA